MLNKTGKAVALCAEIMLVRARNANGTIALKVPISYEQNGLCTWLVSGPAASTWRLQENTVNQNSLTRMKLDACVCVE